MALDAAQDAVARSSNDASTPPNGSVPSDAPRASAFKRQYQACMACRERKVKCNLGDPNNPEPPCSRCKRESKHCYFSTTRRKNHKQDAPPPVEDVVAHTSVRPVKRIKTGNLPSMLPDATGQVPPRPRTPGGSESLAQPLRPREGRGLTADIEDDDPAVIEDTAEVLQRSELHHGPDALGLLSTVALAAQSAFRTRTGSSSSLPRAILAKDGSNGMSGMVAANSPRQILEAKGGVAVASPYSDGKSMISDVKVTDEAMQAWSRMRFVRAGLFSVHEGIEYLNYFYQYLNPLTPVTVPRYHDPSSHGKLLVEEPLLAVTMLTIASRYMSLKGPGAVSRSYRVHDSLWSFLSGQIERLILGQEQFGGGINGTGRKRQNPGLRTLGTVESLLLLTEWHARALHFPPGADSEELLIGDPASASVIGDEDLSEGKVGQIDSWLEPCWRSDRMVWSMLAIAQSLAAELNVFTKNDDPNMTFESHHQADEYRRRKENVRRLLYIYMSQTSGRLNLPSTMNRELCTDLFPHGPPLIGKTQLRRSSSQPIPYYQIQETVLYFWYGIAQLFSDGNAKLFPSRDATRQIINSGRYGEMLAEYETSAKRWQDEFQQCNIIPIHMRNILIIEYEYALIYVNSIGLQAVINRCTDNAQSGVVPPASLLEMLQGDRIYLEAIIKSSQKFLRAVVDGLLPEGYLKHSPVRTYLRIISVSMMLLKAFALGATGNDVSESLNLLDRATKALKDCVVDDVHIGSSVAELIGTLTQRARSRMIRIKAGTDRKSQSALRVPPPQASRTMRPSASQTSHPDATSPPSASYRPPNSAWSSSNAIRHSPSYSTPNQSITSPYYSNDQPPNMSIMPPSTWTPEAGFFGGSPYDTQNQTHYDSGYGLDFSQQAAEWCSLPLDNVLLGGQGGDVTQTGYGLDIGGRDMLNLLLMDDMQRNGQGGGDGSGGHEQPRV